MRQISENFIYDLKNPDGLLHLILKRVKEDHTLQLAIRNNYINIYYRGGNILQVTEQSKGSYETFFNKDYVKSGETLPDAPKIERKEHTEKWVNAFPQLKKVMDISFSTNTKTEREFQQLVARENNNSTISKESEYFITDIEFNDQELGARFDMLAIRWLASDRSAGRKWRAALIEMKYGDNALHDDSGLLNHIEDVKNLIDNPDKYKCLLKTMESQFRQLDELGLIKFSHSEKYNDYKNSKKEEKKGWKLNANDKPEVIIILANHNPRERTLEKRILNNEKLIEWVESGRFDLRFFVSSFAGYGLHSNCMFPLTAFRELLERFNPKRYAAPDSNSD